ncbi:MULTISPECIES: DNA/RNA non-specific endonuclease [unclassified Crossiella]|uniref:DNA/RNA non-specific endonuclease n=1 Tax=unclassified Crossiella TaxID=2620835 RepID=UPI001FFE9E58|nr:MULTISPECIES: DNA/RNA non-specific endonuclease [unclassified Crossiella]MCK2243652.1 DNA/RNA non-specific endonuclease [Crossiella sp. S99.2]MCK2257510.1 DNA/RNA non-specific endonuclease [Crossiella sp. S99.1]
MSAEITETVPLEPPRPPDAASATGGQNDGSAMRIRGDADQVLDQEEPLDSASEPTTLDAQGPNDAERTEDLESANTSETITSGDNNDNDELLTGEQDLEVNLESDDPAAVTEQSSDDSAVESDENTTNQAVGVSAPASFVASDAGVPANTGETAVVDDDDRTAEPADGSVDETSQSDAVETSDSGEFGREIDGDRSEVAGENPAMNDDDTAFDADFVTLQDVGGMGGDSVDDEPADNRLDAEAVSRGTEKLMSGDDDVAAVAHIDEGGDPTEREYLPEERHANGQAVVESETENLATNPEAPPVGRSEGAGEGDSHDQESGDLREVKVDHSSKVSNQPEELDSGKFDRQGAGVDTVNKNEDGVRAHESGKPVRDVVSGEKGAWNKELNKPLPNTIYRVDDRSTYETDAQSRVIRVEGQIGSNADVAVGARNAYQQRVAGRADRQSGDEGGHLIASRLGGAGEAINLVAMSDQLNSRGQRRWYNMESEISRQVESGGSVDLTIIPKYSMGGVRPDSFDVTYRVTDNDGVVTSRQMRFKNR